MLIERDITPSLRQAARAFPAVTLTGPRQSGKSTLCRKIFPKLAYVSLEAPDIRAFLAQFPRGAIFETWVVSEILKHRTNRGEPRGLSFYRDRDMVEADLLIQHPPRQDLDVVDQMGHSPAWDQPAR